MSHTARYKTEIRNPDAELLKKALKAVANKHELELRGTILYLPRGHRHIRVVWPRVLANGQLLVEGDSYYLPGLREIAAEIPRTYTALAYVQALQAAGYEIGNIEELETGAIVIEGLTA